jgi:hypothetical protein
MDVRSIRLIGGAALLALGLTLSSALTASAHGSFDSKHHDDPLAEIDQAARRGLFDRIGLLSALVATSRFQNVNAAKAAGYGELKDAQGIACIDNPGIGGMGIHYANGTLVGDPAVDARRPEVLVYEPRRNGKLELVALEYVVFKEAWDATHSGPPKLFGREFSSVQAGNRYGLPAFYELHAWLWEFNPRGIFDDWNPRVRCP